MKIYINGQSDIVAAESDSDLGLIFAQLRDFIKSNRMLVESMHLDGVLVTPEIERKSGSDIISKYQKLEVKARDTVASSLEILSNIEELVPSLSKSVRDCVPLLQNNSAKASDALKKIFETFQDIYNGIKSVTTILPIDLKKFQVGKKSLDTCFGEMSSLLSQIHNSMNAKDFANLSDLLEYDLTEKITEWGAMASAIKASVDGN